MADIAKPVTVITGTSKGIGRGLAEYFINQGHSVFGCSRGPGSLDIEGYHHSQVDVSDEIQVRQWIRQIKSTAQKIDVLVCNAGLVGSVLPATVTAGETLDTFLSANAKSTFLVCREVAKVMILHRYGRIITFASLAVPLHLEGAAAYAASKAAVIEVTKILAKELAPFGITCNAMSPALIMTDPAQRMGQEWAKRLLEKQTIKRLATIEEICHLVAFLASPQSGMITGQVIYMGLVD